jgi:ELP3 family radical SAM enzyme/protein acetyltransferase
MHCNMKSMNQIEELHTNFDSRFDANNLVKYENIVKDLINSNVRGLTFEKEYNKIQRRSDITVKKTFLVYAYQSMLHRNIIKFDPVFWLLIQKCPTRTMSGVNSFALLLSPHPDTQNFSCKHNCYYCPDESIKNGAEFNIPRSYLKKEPAVARGFRNNWDAHNQLQNRLNSLLMQGHLVDKLEIVIEGGTYTEYPLIYLEKFHRDIFYTANTFFDDLPKRLKLSVYDEMLINVTTKVRIIGICIETRPDAIDDTWIKFFRHTGTTRIQLGVQHTNDTILRKINRGHTFQQSIEAVEFLKNNGFKVDIHLMPDLPGSSPEEDKRMFDLVFKTLIIQPDQVKIYPCEVVPYTVIKKWFDNNKFIPYSNINPRELIDVVKHAMLICPPWIRLPRIVRDIPLSYIEGGNKCVNMRQVIDNEIKLSQNIMTHDIRAREIGRNNHYDFYKSKYTYRTYKSDGYTEYFISLESKDKKAIFGFIRLRIPHTKHTPVFNAIQNTGLVRELHVYNNIVPVGAGKVFKHNLTTQHRGVGKTLLKIAEFISWSYNLSGVSVISGEGVRGYYHMLGYKDVETYCIKKFNFTLIHTFNLLILNLFILYLSYNYNYYSNNLNYV